MDTMQHAERKKVREHPAELKARVLAQCELPGASVARVAQEHGLNANLVHAWRRQRRQQSQPEGGQPVARAGAQEFIALPLAPPAARDSGDIRIEMRRGATTVTIGWPAEAAAECVAWLGQWLR